MLKAMRNGRELAKKAICTAAAASLVLSMSAAGFAPAKAYAAQAMSPEGYVIGAQAAAGVATPSMLGLTNPEMRTSDETRMFKDPGMYGEIFGTSINSSPDPYVWNYKNDVTPKVMNGGRGNPMAALATFNSDDSSAPQNSIWLELPDVVIATGGSTDPNFYADSARLVETAKGLEEGSYNPIAVNYVATNLNTFIATVYNIAAAADSVAASDSSKKLRYGSATAIAKQYEEYITGAKGSVLKAINNGTTARKTFASIQSYDSATGSFTIIPAETQEGTAAGNRYIEAVQYVANNLFDNDAYGVKSPDGKTKTVSIADLTNSGAYLLVGGQSVSNFEDTVAALNTAGLMGKTFYVDGNNSFTGTVFGVTMNSTENAQNVGRILSFVYPEVLDQSDMLAYYYDCFYHLNNAAVTPTCVKYLQGVRNANVMSESGSTTYTTWTEADFSSYNKANTAAVLRDGMAYVVSNPPAETALRATSNYTSSALLIGSATISSIADQTYTGAEIKPAITVTHGSKKLVEGTHYTVSYLDNINAGEARVVITGINDYIGNKTATFKIKGIDISKATIADIEVQPYTGKAVEPAVSVSLDDKALVKDTDFTVAYKNNINAGTATVTITGKGNYAGTATKNFTISTSDAAKAVVTLSATSKTYTGKAIKPGVTVKLDGKTLVAGTDYSVAYKNNKAVGKATVTVTLKGNYKGTKTKTFKIIPKKVSGIKATGGKKAITIKWTRGASSYTTGYQVKVATSKSGLSKAKAKTINKYKTNYYKLSKLKSKKKYCYQVRTYKKAGGNTYYSAWSTVKYVKTK